MSFGDPQTVQVNARRDIGRITMHYRINDGRERTARTEEWDGGERYGDEGDYWYHRVRGVVRGTDPGDEVEVWFDGENKRARATTSRAARSRTTCAATRVRGCWSSRRRTTPGNSAFPAYPIDRRARSTLSYYADALEANGVDYDVYDLDAEGRVAPDALGVLSHYDAVIWETGNDNVTRPRRSPAWRARRRTSRRWRCATSSTRAARVALAGVNAGRQYDLVEYPQDGLPLEHLRRRLDHGRRRRLRPALERLPPVLPGVVHPS